MSDRKVYTIPVPLTELEKLSEAAPEGRLEVFSGNEFALSSESDIQRLGEVFGVSGPQAEAAATFIVALWNGYRDGRLVEG